MPKLKVNEDDMDLLTEEERIGLKEYQLELEAEMEAEDAMIAAAANGDPEDEPAPKPKPDEDEDEDEPEPEEPTPGQEEEPIDVETEEPTPDEAPEEQPDDDVDEDEDEDDEAAEEPEIPPTGPVAHKLTAAEEARFGAIDKALDDIADKFDEGEITAREMREQSKALVSELDALKEKRAVSKMSDQVVVDTWYGVTIPAFLAAHSEYVEGTLRHKLLDTIVREIQVKSSSPTDPRILTEAHKRIVEELGQANGHDKKEPAKKKKASGKARDLPPNLNNIPASDATPVTAINKFARLEKLKGADYERALARLSPTDRDYYLQYGS